MKQRSLRWLLLWRDWEWWRVELESRVVVILLLATHLPTGGIIFHRGSQILRFQPSPTV